MGSQGFMKNIAAISIISVFVTLLSLFLPVKIYSSQGLSQVKLGFPLHFITQNYHFTPEKYPTYISLSSPWESPIQVLFPSFILDLLILFTVLFALFKFAKKFAFKH
jgi:hypothetical protein